MKMFVGIWQHKRGKVGTGPVPQESALHQKRISGYQIKMQLNYHAQFNAEIYLSGL
jgi:hypothetical protein